MRYDHWFRRVGGYTNGDHGLITDSLAISTVGCFATRRGNRGDEVFVVSRLTSGSSEARLTHCLISPTKATSRWRGGCATARDRGRCSSAFIGNGVDSFSSGRHWITRSK